MLPWRLGCVPLQEYSFRFKVNTQRRLDAPRVFLHQTKNNAYLGAMSRACQVLLDRGAAVYTSRAH